MQPGYLTNYLRTLRGSVPQSFRNEIIGYFKGRKEDDRTYESFKKISVSNGKDVYRSSRSSSNAYNKQTNDDLINFMSNITLLQTDNDDTSHKHKHHRDDNNHYNNHHNNHHNDYHNNHHNDYSHTSDGYLSHHPSYP
jgi:hypothetical protein